MSLIHAATERYRRLFGHQPAPDPEPAPATEVNPELLAFASAANERLQGMLAERLRKEARQTAIAEALKTAATPAHHPGPGLDDELAAIANATRARSADYRQAATRYEDAFGSEAPHIDARPIPRPADEEHLSPLERAWNRLTPDEQKWSSK